METVEKGAKESKCFGGTRVTERGGSRVKRGLQGGSHGREASGAGNAMVEQEDQNEGEGKQG